MNEIWNEIWIVTGANFGFGRAITEAAVGAGNIAIAATRRREALADLVAAHPDRIEALSLDVTDQTATAVADIAARYGHIDVLLNNASRCDIGAFEETSDAELRVSRVRSAPARPATPRSAPNCPPTLLRSAAYALASPHLTENSPATRPVIVSQPGECAYPRRQPCVAGLDALAGGAASCMHTHRSS
ncbi:SDR family NAD(P)-dependent oxidoreductase [Nocardia sp. NBC_00565]|uniref:SDR family NAD(P)-dependent oxidoreductase n=1 Tax=Nocardia sp. NBC_00565 TaxID=2975993 RepID=UPI002E80EE23|nr:SDR family NAD(P)-dependent oxidoreductase [Nocardia sp. NBC_00565]WUC02548.1 SDR family NAD(P)-dependent oxidoreductase [Nocardia sp. NBC_00565]